MVRFTRIIALILFASVLITGCNSAPIEATPTITPTNMPATATPLTFTPTGITLTATFTTEEVQVATNPENSNSMEANHMMIQIGDTFLTVTLVENSSVDALIEVLKEGPLTIDMQDYGNMEKVGSLGMDLPRNDEQITTGAGDIILYQGNMLVIYYAPNAWNFTRLGKIENVTAEELRQILGDGDVTVMLSLP